MGMVAEAETVESSRADWAAFTRDVFRDRRGMSRRRRACRDSEPRSGIDIAVKQTSDSGHQGGRQVGQIHQT
jgi:hypothetical protein